MLKVVFSTWLKFVFTLYISIEKAQRQKRQLSSPKLWLNKFVKLVQLANIFNHWPKFWWELNQGPWITSPDRPLIFLYHLYLEQSLVLCITMHEWFCQIEPIESIGQKKAELRESSNMTGKSGLWSWDRETAASW